VRGVVEKLGIKHIGMGGATLRLGGAWPSQAPRFSPQKKKKFKKILKKLKFYPKIYYFF
jgi:hypothetical protein